MTSTSVSRYRTCAERRARFKANPYYTFRRENTFLPNNFDIGSNPNDPGNLLGELQAFIGAGVDGFFTDNPDIGAAAVPEPASLTLVGLTGALLATRRR
jgi:glycerophosphoryl diester phosphodiesterase